MKRITYLYALLFSLVILSSRLTLVSAQDETSDSPISIGADLMSRYVWRGLDYGASPSIQPYIETEFAGFTIGAWGAYTTNLPGVQEMDIYINYTFSDLVTIGVTDYFFPNEIFGYDYYEFRSDSSGHLIEVFASFNGLENLPLTAMVGLNLYNDSNNSIYFELGYSFSFVDVFLGAGNGFYSTDKEFGIVNLGISAAKEIPVTEKYALPLSVSLITNPNAKRIHLVFGISF